MALFQAYAIEDGKKETKGIAESQIIIPMEDFFDWPVFFENRRFRLQQNDAKK